MTLRKHMERLALAGNPLYQAYVYVNGLQRAVRRYGSSSTAISIYNVHSLLRMNSSPEARERKEALLSRRLCSLLRNALTHVPYYRETVRIRASDICPENAHQALGEFPYLTKSMVMDNHKAILDERLDTNRLIYTTSGGSTGRGVGIWATREELEIERTFYRHYWGRYGYSDYHRIVRFGTDARKKPHENPCEVRGNRLLISPYHLNDDWIEEIFDAIVRFHPDAIHSYPSCLEYLARYMSHADRPQIKCRGVLLASEACSVQQCELFSKCFTGHISVNYGLSERTNLAFASYTSGVDDLAFKLDDVYGVSESRQDDEGYSEIVGTSYWNRTMPLIRYCTQDYGVINDNGIIERLDGRKQEFLITKSGARIPGFSIKIDEFTWQYVSVMQIVQKTPGSIIIRIIPNGRYTETVGRMILRKHLDRWGTYFDMSLETTGAISRTGAGKHRLVVSEIQG